MKKGIIKTKKEIKKEIKKDINILFHRKQNKIYSVIFYNTKYFFNKFIKTFQKINIPNDKKTFSIFERKNIKNIENILKVKNKYKFEKFINFFEPTDKSHWSSDFKTFTFFLSTILTMLTLFFFTEKFLNEVDKIKNISVLAKDNIENVINNKEPLDTKIVQNQLVSTFDSLYKIDSEISSLTKGVFNFFGGIINVKESDIIDITRKVDESSQIAIDIVNILQKNKDVNLLFKTKIINSSLNSIYNNINYVEDKLSLVNYKILPKEYERKFEDILSKISTIKENINKLVLISGIANSILGEDSTNRTLFLFANSNEIRANGGFMGSYALVDFDKGEITKMEIPKGGIYDLKGGFYKDIEPPFPFKLINKKWEIQDANWFLDFPKSAKKMQEFFENSANGSTVDSVVVINSNALGLIIELTGDIELKKYNVVVTKDNVVDVLQDDISSKRNKTNKPKEIITDLFSAVSEKLMILDSDNMMKLVSLLSDVISKKQVLVYFNNNENLNNSLKTIGLDGEIIKTKNNEDYLAIIDTNLGLTKTSQELKRSLSHNIEIFSNGDIVSTLKIKKSLDNKSKFDKNIDFVRIYTPKGSKLVYSQGFSNIDVNTAILPDQVKDKDLEGINELSVRDKDSGTLSYIDEDKTVFANFTRTNKGEETESIISYELPFKFDFNKNIFKKQIEYILVNQKQPGIDDMDYSLSITYPKDKLEISNSDFYINDEIKTNLDKDRIIDIIFKKK